MNPSLELAVDEDPAIPGKEITGVSQKGPFLLGSSVTIQELDGDSLNQTGKSFKASVKSKSGDFAVNVEDLVSQYVLLEIKGYYYNEVTDEMLDIIYYQHQINKEVYKFVTMTEPPVRGRILINE